MKVHFHVKDEDFRISSWSKNNPKTCVAVAMKSEGVAVRNSNDPTKNTLFFSNDEWTAFLKGAQAGEFGKV
ncbi:MAG: DUF397 domain-containing protein [bacterium]|nr:DUF397 domain-containing protein [bacterium]